MFIQFFLMMVFSVIVLNPLSAQTDLPLTYLWKPKYYASVEGQELSLIHI